MKNKISFKDAYGGELFTFMCIFTLLVSYPLGLFARKFVYMKNMPDVMILNILCTCVIGIVAMLFLCVTPFMLYDFLCFLKRILCDKFTNTYEFLHNAKNIYSAKEKIRKLPLTKDELNAAGIHSLEEYFNFLHEQVKIYFKSPRKLEKSKKIDDYLLFEIHSTNITNNTLFTYAQRKALNDSLNEFISNISFKDFCKRNGILYISDYKSSISFVMKDAVDFDALDKVKLFENVYLDLSKKEYAFIIEIEHCYK